MELQQGTQVVLSGRSAVVLSVTEFPGGAAITIFWPATYEPPSDLGLRGIGSWRTKLVTLLQLNNGGPCLWDIHQPARLMLNDDPRTYIRLESWMQAFLTSSQG